MQQAVPQLSSDVTMESVSHSTTNVMVLMTAQMAVMKTDHAVCEANFFFCKAHSMHFLTLLANMCLCNYTKTNALIRHVGSPY